MRERENGARVPRPLDASVSVGLARFARIPGTSRGSAEDGPCCFWWPEPSPLGTPPPRAAAHGGGGAKVERRTGFY